MMSRLHAHVDSIMHICATDLDRNCECWIRTESVSKRDRKLCFELLYELGTNHKLFPIFRVLQNRVYDYVSKQTRFESSVQ